MGEYNTGIKSRGHELRYQLLIVFKVNFVLRNKESDNCSFFPPPKQAMAL